MSEEWRPVVGFEGFYEVSDLGRVRSVARSVPCYGGTRNIKSRVLKGSPERDGYLMVSLSKGNGSKQHSHKIHRLVLEAFVGPMPDGMESLHGDGDPANCLLSNLRYGTPVDNWQDRRKHGRGIDGDRNPHAIMKARSNV